MPRSPDPGPEPARVIRPRRPLPGNRAVAGGLLVVLATATAWWAAVGGGRGPVPSYVVAARPIGPGQVLAAEDLRRESVDLPAALRARAFTEPADLVGTVALGPLDTGELLQAGGVTGPGGDDEAVRELSFAVEPDWAVDGDLRPGDRIDLFATYGDGTSSQTVRVLAAATVRRLGSAGGDGFGERRSQTITLGLAPGVEAAAVVNATRAGTVTVLRVTGATDGGEGSEETARPYRVGEALEPGSSPPTTARGDDTDGSGG